MSFRFRKSFGSKGLRLNVSSRGVSVSVLGVNFSQRGVTAGFTIPGTGISYRTRLTPTLTERRRAAAASLRAMRALEAQQRALAAQQRDAAILRRAAQARGIDIDAEGTPHLQLPSGEALSAEDMDLCWKLAPDALRSIVAGAIEGWTAAERAALEIHLDTPAPTEPRPYRRRPFLPAEPALHHPFAFTDQAPQAMDLPARTLWDILWPPARRRWQEACERADEDFLRRRREWERLGAEFDARQQQLVAESRASHANWAAERDSWNAEEDRHEKGHQARLGSDADYAEDVASAWLQDVEWPRATTISFECDPTGMTVALDIDLPEIEDLNAETLEVRRGGRRVERVRKTGKSLREDYARHIHAIVFRAAGEVFAALPATRTVVASGFSQRKSRQTAHVEDEYLISAIIRRAEWEAINFGDLAALDVIEAMDRFEIRRTMSATHLLRPVQPFGRGEAA